MQPILEDGAMGKSEWLLEPGVVREELRLSQAGFADLLGVSTRAVQSWEQGWRKPSSALQKSILLALIAWRQGDNFGARMCWEAKDCPQATRERCLAYRGRQGHLCWFMTGNICQGRRLRNWPDKMAFCGECTFFQALLDGKRCTASEE